MDKTFCHGHGWSLERLDAGHEPLEILVGGAGVEEEAKDKGEGGDKGRGSGKGMRRQGQHAGAGVGDDWSGRRRGWWAFGKGVEEASSVGCATVRGARDVRSLRPMMARRGHRYRWPNGSCLAGRPEAQPS